MTSLDLPYVVHTAEIAQLWNDQHPHDIYSINQLVEHVALDAPNLVVAGMPMLTVQDDEEMWRMHQLSK